MIGIGVIATCAIVAIGLFFRAQFIRWGPKRWLASLTKGTASACEPRADIARIQKWHDVACKAGIRAE